MIKDPIELVEQYLTEPISRLAGRTGNLTFDTDGESLEVKLPELIGGMDFSQFATSGALPPVGEAAQPPSADPAPFDLTSGQSLVEIRKSISLILRRGPGRTTRAGDKVLGPVYMGVGNIITILNMDPDYSGKLRRNTMDNCIYMNGVELPESMAVHIQMWLLQVYNLNFTSVSMVRDAIGYVADQYPFNPLQDMLRGMTWDGVDRVPQILELLKIEPTRLHYHYWERWGVGAVSRAMEPGSQMDYILVLSGEEGLGKSSTFKLLAYGYPWFSDSGLDMGSKDALQCLQKRWIYEIPEIDEMLARAATGTVKAWITSSIDSFRAPYAREVAGHPRTCILCGTTNKVYILTDHEGARRFWVVPVGNFEKSDVAAWINSNRDQFWAQMVHLYGQGVKPLLPKEMEAKRKEANSNFMASNMHEEILMANIKRIAEKYKNIADVAEYGLSMKQVFDECDMDGKRISVAKNLDLQAMAEVMRKHGMYKRRVGHAGQVKWFFKAGEIEKIFDIPVAELNPSSVYSCPAPNSTDLRGFSPVTPIVHPSVCPLPDFDV